MSENTFKESYIVKEKEMTSLCVYNTGYEKCLPLHQWGPGVRNHYLLHYIVSGCGTYHYGEQTITLTAGDAFLVYPDSAITYRADENNPWEYYWVGFHGTEAHALIQNTAFSYEQPFIHAGELGEQLKQSLLAIYQSRGTSVAHAAKMTGELYLMLSILFENAESLGKKRVSDTSYVKAAIEFISSNYSYPISIDDVARYVGISRSHLFRQFQIHYHISPKEYLTECRINHACNLLKHSSLSITEIANSVGYDNSLYFSKAFHKIKGTSPSEYAGHHRLYNK